MTTHPILLWLSLYAALGCAAAASADPPAGYKLAWSDEFDADGAPDPAKWDYERGFVRNREDQWYQPENAAVRDGLLVITGRREQQPNPGYDPEGRDWRTSREHTEYTSSCLITRGKFTWQYGLLEVRARVDARPGLWPAIWTLGERGPWPACGEVDVMEFYQGDILANACWRAGRGDRSGGELSRDGRVMWDAVRRPIGEFGDADWPNEFHVWRMDWTAERIRLSIDDKLVNEIDLSKVPEDERGPNSFHQPHYLLLNLAIGGTQGGDPSGTEFPATFEVDYVRVFQSAE